jgi:hypothetical protein
MTMRVDPSEVLRLAVRAESARQPNLARELYTLAGRMDREHGTDGLEPSPEIKSRELRDTLDAAWARGYRLAVRLGLDPESIAVAEAAGRVS